MYKEIKNDFRINSFKSGYILFSYRIQNFFWRKIKNKLLQKIILQSTRFIFGSINMILSINTQIAFESSIGKNLRLPHSANGVIISSRAVIEDNVTIFQQVTIGINDRKKMEDQKIILKKGSYISAGAKIINCTIGQNTIIGPNVFVNMDIEDNMLILPGEVQKINIILKNNT